MFRSLRVSTPEANFQPQATGFKWYDLEARRYTWQYLADATEAMVNSVGNAAVEAYWRLLLNQVLKTLFNPTNHTATINGNNYNVYKFYNADGTVPPAYKNNTFSGSHTHYKTSVANSVLEATDLDTLVIDYYTSHGYSQENGYNLVVKVNTALGNQIRNFRSAVNAVQAVGGNYGRYDFIPAAPQPGQIAVDDPGLRCVAGTRQDRRPDGHRQLRSASDRGRRLHADGLPGQLRDRWYRQPQQPDRSAPACRLEPSGSAAGQGSQPRLPPDRFLLGLRLRYRCAAAWWRDHHAAVVLRHLYRARDLRLDRRCDA